MAHKNKNIQILNNLIQPESTHDRELLEHLWASLPDDPKICWYPSAGLCVRDLLVWRSRGLDQHFSEPDLFIHTDYVGPNDHRHEHADKFSRTKVLSSHTMRVNGPVHYRVAKAFSHFPEKASTSPCVSLQEVYAKSFEFGETTKPVLMFHFENFNWFDQFVIQHGLRLSHFFKLRDGTGFGGTSISVCNVYPKLAAAGVRELVLDTYINWERWLLNEYYAGKPSLPTKPFALERIRDLGSMSGLETHAYRLSPTDHEDWFDSVAQTIAEGPDRAGAEMPSKLLSSSADMPVRRHWMGLDELF